MCSGIAIYSVCYFLLVTETKYMRRLIDQHAIPRHGDSISVAWEWNVELEGRSNYHVKVVRKDPVTLRFFGTP